MSELDDVKVSLWDARTALSAATVGKIVPTSETNFAATTLKTLQKLGEVTSRRTEHAKGRAEKLENTDTEVMIAVGTIRNTLYNSRPEPARQAWQGAAEYQKAFGETVRRSENNADLLAEMGRRIAGILEIAQMYSESLTSLAESAEATDVMRDKTTHAIEDYATHAFRENWSR
jgi:hypothetical protein